MTMGRVVLSAVTVAGTGLIFLIIFLMLTSSKRRGLEDAAEIELEEIRAMDPIKKGRPVFLRKKDNGEEEEQKEKMETDAGRELLKLERRGLVVMGIGMILALIASILYWTIY